jgi:GT2 family glycosyltransferase
MVSFIIVNYNTTALTRACVASIYQYTKGVAFEVWVVDNASPDRGITELKTIFPELRLILLPENIGFGRANNEAIKQAKGDFIFLLNSDAELQSDAASAFCAYLQAPGHEQVGVCGGHLFTRDGRATPSYGNFPSLLQRISASGLLYLYRSFYRMRLDTGVANTRDDIRQVDFISGAAMFIRKSVLDACGAFDPDFFLYFEETEMSKRFSRAGYSSMIIPAVRILHHEAGSSAGKGFQAFPFYHFERSRRLYYRKVYGWWFVCLAFPFDLLDVCVRALVGKQRGHLGEKVRLFLGAHLR